MCDAMMHGVLDERLEHERRYSHTAYVVGDIDLRAQPFAEPHALDRHESLDQGDLFSQGDRLLPPERQTLAEELGHEKAHLARGHRVRADQRRDRVQTIEEKV